jgi:hypothetical protein
MSLFSRYCALRRTHPMSGGIARVRLDRVKDFIRLRKETFGFELAPLPRSLQLSNADTRLNGLTEPRVRPSLPQVANRHVADPFQSSMSGIPETVGR